MTTFNPLIHLTCLCLSLLSATFSLSGQDIFLMTGDGENKGHAHNSTANAISPNGRFVLFTTGQAFSGTSPGISAGGLYVRDLASGRLSYVPGTSAVVDGDISDDGRYVVWGDNKSVITFVDRLTGNTETVTQLTGLFDRQPNDGCHNPQISADGRYVAYLSIATNLKLTDSSLMPPNKAPYVVLWDRETGLASVATVSSEGTALDLGYGGVNAAEEFALSPDGQYLFFSSASTNVHPDRPGAPNQTWFWLYRRHLETGTVEVVSRNGAGAIPSGNFTTPRVSFDGNRVLMAGGFVGLGGGPSMIDGYDASFSADLYLKDLQSGSVTRVSATSDGARPDGFFGGHDLSPDGRRVAFASSSRNFPEADDDNFFDIFMAVIAENGSPTLTRVSRDPNGSENVDFHDGPFAADSYVCFGTSQWEIMLGVPEFWPSRHTIGIGTPPGIDGQGSGGDFQLVGDDVWNRPVAISADAGRILVFEDSVGFKIGSPTEGLTLIPGTAEFVSAYSRTVATRNLDQFVAEGEYNGTYSFIRWTEAEGVVVLPEPPGWNEASFRAFAIFDDGRLLVDRFSGGENSLLIWSPETGYSAFDPSALGDTVSVKVASPAGVIAGLATTNDPVNGPASVVWRWSDETGFEVLGNPSGQPVSGLYLHEISPDGRLLLGRQDAFPDDFQFTWTPSEGFVLTPSPDNVALPHLLSPNGSMGAVDMGVKLLWDRQRGLLDPVNEILSYGVDPAVFANARISEIRQIVAHAGKTYIFGQITYGNFPHRAFLATLPYVAGFATPALPRATAFFGPQFAQVDGEVHWSGVFDYLSLRDDSGWAFLDELNCWAWFNFDGNPLAHPDGCFVWLTDANGLQATGGQPDAPSTWAYLNASMWGRTGTESYGFLHAYQPFNGLSGWLIFAEMDDANRLWNSDRTLSLVIRNPTPGY